MPEELRRFEKALRRYGLERYAEEFAESLNRAAEAAVPVAKPVLLAAIRDMSLSDAVGIVRGDDDAATRYFRAHTDAVLREHLKPIVAEATARANVTAAYKRLMKKAAFLEKAVEPGYLDLDTYVTRAALDGLYLLMAEEERRIRRNPLARTTDLLKKYSADRGNKKTRRGAGFLCSVQFLRSSCGNRCSQTVRRFRKW